MYQVIRIIQQNTDPLYGYSDRIARLAKLLYNASLFRIRQVFYGWDRDPQERSRHEQEVFREVSNLQQAFPSVRVRRVISYQHLEKLMRVNHNPDFFAEGLPKQTAQAVVRQAVQDFKNWLASLRDYKKSPDKYLGKPKMPGYKKSDTCTFQITNQDAVLNGTSSGSELKLPLTKQRLSLSMELTGTLKEVTVKPYYGRYAFYLIMEVKDVPTRTDLPNLAAIDFGTDNIAAFVCTDHTSAIYKGGAVLSNNQWFAKQKARFAGIITRGHSRMRASSRRLTDLSYHHANFQLDQMHKISRDIVSRCLEHNAGTLVLGANRYWKQDCGIGKANNQKFTAVPVTLLRQLILYKAAAAGITVIEQEEDYTSKADVTAGDYIPTYGVDDWKASFSGSRIRRGLYRCHNGLVINADCNGAANILRKAVPDAWDKTKDFKFLATPEVLGFHELNPSSIPVKRIAAA